MDIVRRLRNHALPDPHDEREVLHAPLLREAADEIAKLHNERADLTNFVATLKELERDALAVIEAVGVDVPVTVPHRDYESMTPKDCYEAGLMDGGVAVRQAIRAAIDAVSTRR